jgi:hypothetical protein
MPRRADAQASRDKLGGSLAASRYDMAQEMIEPQATIRAVDEALKDEEQ